MYVSSTRIEPQWGLRKVRSRFQGIENAHMSLVVVLKIRKVFRSTLRNLFNRNAGGDGRFRDRRSEKYLDPPQTKCEGDRGHDQCELNFRHSPLHPNPRSAPLGW